MCVCECVSVCVCVCVCTRLIVTMTKDVTSTVKVTRTHILLKSWKNRGRTNHNLFSDTPQNDRF